MFLSSSKRRSRCARRPRPLSVLSLESLEARVVLAGDFPVAAIEVLDVIPYVQDEQVNFDALATPGQPGDTLTYQWRTYQDNGDYEFDPLTDIDLVDANLDPSSSQYSYHASNTGRYWVTLTVTDQENEVSNLAVESIDVMPFSAGELVIALVGEPFFFVGQPIQFQGVDHREIPGDLHYEWDVFRDENYGDIYNDGIDSADTLITSAQGVDLVSFNFSADEVGFYIVRLRTFADGNESREATFGFDAEGGNDTVEPTIDPTHSLVAEGTPVVFTGSAGIEGGLIFDYSWQIFEVGGSTALVTQGETGVTEIAPFSFTPADEGQFEVRLTVTGVTSTGETSAIVDVENVAPSIDSVAGPSQSIPGLPIDFSADVNDAGSTDTLTTSWEVLDAALSPVLSGTGSEFTFTPSVLGDYTVRFTTIDGDGGSAEETRLVAVRSSAVAGTDLFVAATDTGSNITIDTSSGSLLVSVDGSEDTYDQPVTAIVVYGGSGDDSIQITASAPAIMSFFASTTTTSTLRITVRGEDGNDIISAGPGVTASLVLDGGEGHDILMGGDGNDILLGGSGIDLLFGGAGNDVLVGGDDFDVIFGDSGRDVLIGGRGGDTLFGNGNEDVMIAGYTDSDDDLETLSAVSDAWSEGTIAARSAILALIDVYDDNVRDFLTGGGSLDWYFANLIRDAGDTGSSKDVLIGATGTERSMYEELMDE